VNPLKWLRALVNWTFGHEPGKPPGWRTWIAHGAIGVVLGAVHYEVGVLGLAYYGGRESLIEKTAGRVIGLSDQPLTTDDFMDVVSYLLGCLVGIVVWAVRTGSLAAALP